MLSSHQPENPEKETTEKQTIEEAFGENIDGKRKEYIEILKEEENLWHNNVDLPYQKKLKRS